MRTEQQTDGWSAEVRIPLRVIRFPVGDQEQAWGFQIERVIQSTNETIQRAPGPPNFGLSRLEYFGHLEGISGIQSSRNTQVVPYVAAGRSRIRAGDLEGTAEGSTAVSVPPSTCRARGVRHRTWRFRVIISSTMFGSRRVPSRPISRGFA